MYAQTFSIEVHNFTERCFALSGQCFKSGDWASADHHLPLPAMGYTELLFESRGFFPGVGGYIYLHAEHAKELPSAYLALIFNNPLAGRGTFGAVLQTTLPNCEAEWNNPNWTIPAWEQNGALEGGRNGVAWQIAETGTAYVVRVYLMPKDLASVPQDLHDSWLLLQKRFHWNRLRKWFSAAAEDAEHFHFPDVNRWLTQSETNGIPEDHSLPLGLPSCSLEGSSTPLTVDTSDSSPMSWTGNGKPLEPDISTPVATVYRAGSKMSMMSASPTSAGMLSEVFAASFPDVSASEVPQSVRQSLKALFKRHSQRPLTFVPSELVNASAFASVQNELNEHREALAWPISKVQLLMSDESLYPDAGSIAVAALREPLRHGCPNGLKRLVWLEASGARQFAAKLGVGAAQRYYHSMSEEAFGSEIPDHFTGKVPTFSAGVELAHSYAPELHEVAAPFFELLAEPGVLALQRLLWVFQLLFSELEFCPILPPLLAALLLYVREAEAFATGRCLVEAAKAQLRDKEMLGEEDNQLRLIFTVDMYNKFIKRFVEVGEVHLHEIFDHLKKLKFDVYTWAASVFRNGLVQILPFQAALRAYGSFLCEGVRVFERYALALLQLNRFRLLQASDATQAEAVLQSLNQGIDVDKLTKTAFSFKLVVAVSQPLRKLSPSFCTSGLEAAPARVFCRPRVHDDGFVVLSPETFGAVYVLLPESKRVLDPHLVFATGRDGFSVQWLLRKCELFLNMPMVFVIRTSDHGIVGGYATMMWRATGGQYVSPEEPDGECVFWIPPDSDDVEEALWWNPRFGSDGLMYAGSSAIVFGQDDAAVSLDAELCWGSSAPSRAFGPLAVLGGSAEVVNFKCVEVEVFALL